ncbi:hypothetical protein KIH39_03800 [Telmatocola sphagniphila]|uniref:Uncharacterized protein n=1 Tax=Telmatocola sphagniphila TaxID=1123043 RepID=A0A8E6B8F8_9BACT|nr:DUF6263 family protein [Telmatocola sphagniphila]QVL33051.1 hypothetical protein KIH39_03800 [Telmatocola sphagniphila]
MLKLRLASLLGLMLLFGVTFSQAQEAKKDAAKKDPPKVEPKAEPKAEAKAPTPSADGKVDFTWKLEKDKVFYQSTTTSTTQSIKVMGMDVNQTQEQVFYFKWQPLKEEGKKWTIKQTIEGLKMKIDLAGNPIAFDSETSAPAGSQTQLSDFFKSLKNSEFVLTLNEKMKVEKVEGREEFLKKLGQANAQMEALLKTILTEDAMKQVTDPTFGFIPPEPKKIGESWKVTTTLNLGPIGTYDNTSTYTYKAKESDERHIIEVVSEVTYKAPTDNSAGLPFKIKSADLKTKDKTPGQIVYNAKAGRVDEARMVLKITGSMKIEIGGNETPVELNQDQTTVVKISDKSFVTEKK